MDMSWNIRKEGPRTLPFLLGAFALTSVASIALQNILWAAVAFFLFRSWKDGRDPSWPRGPFAWATLAFMASFFLGAFLGIDIPNSFHTVHKYLALSLVLFVGAMPILPGDQGRYLKLLNAGAVICALHGIWKHYWLHQDRIDSFSGDKMVFGGMLMCCLILQLFLTRERPGSWPHWTGLAVLAFALLLTETRGAWIGCAFGASLWLLRYDRRWLAAGALAACLSFFLLPGRFQERVRTIWDIRVTSTPGQFLTSEHNERPFIWMGGWAISRDHPLGIGQGNLGALYPRYKHPLATEPNLPHLHDNFLQILVQNGWEGLILYLAWILAYGWTALRWRGKTDWENKLNWAFLCCFAAVLVWGLTEYTFSHQFMNFQAFLLGLQAALWRSKGGDPKGS